MKFPSTPQTLEDKIYALACMGCKSPIILQVTKGVFVEANTLDGKEYACCEGLHEILMAVSEGHQNLAAKIAATIMVESETEALAKFMKSMGLETHDDRVTVDKLTESDLDMVLVSLKGKEKECDTVAVADAGDSAGSGHAAHDNIDLKAAFDELTLTRDELKKFERRLRASGPDLQAIGQKLQQILQLEQKNFAMRNMLSLPSDHQDFLETFKAILMYLKKEASKEHASN